MYLNPLGHVGGAEVAILELMAALRRSQPDWSLRLVVAGEGPLTTRATALGVPVTVLPFPTILARMGEAGANGSVFGRVRIFAGMCLAAPETHAYAARLRQVISDFGPDVVHTNGLKMHVLGATSAGRAAVIWHLHDYVNSRPITSGLLNQCAPQCRMAIANSMSVARDAQSVFRNGPQIRVLYNAIDTARFYPEGPQIDLDRLCGLPPAEAGTIRVGLMGSFARWKGHSVFFEALSLLPPASRIRGYVVGHSIYQTNGSQYSLAELQRAARRFGLSSKVGFTGYVDQPESALRALDIVVHASTEPEPFGLVIAEAMACGRPVIVSAIGGATEIVQAGVDALAYPAGDAAALASRILELATDSGSRVRLGRAGRATVEQRFDRTRLAAELVPIYRHAIGPHDQGPIRQQMVAAQ
jgi:glycosyltransferase involved in cell wall biosynthesis